MNRQLASKAIRITDPVVNQPGFKQMIEDHLDLLKKENPQSVTVTPEMALRCNGDFDALQTELNIPNNMFWVNMRINGLKNSFDYTYETLEISLVDQAMFERLLVQYKARQR